MHKIRKLIKVIEQDKLQITNLRDRIRELEYKIEFNIYKLDGLFKTLSKPDYLMYAHNEGYLIVEDLEKINQLGKKKK